MKAGKAFEIFVKRILMNVGFLEVQSDDLFVFDGNAGQMVQGLGELTMRMFCLTPRYRHHLFIKHAY